MVETGDKLVVSDGEHEEVTTVSETTSYRGTELANATGDTLDGWVEVPDNPADPGARLVCHECGREEEDEMGNPAGPWVKDVTVGSRETAEVLADIHRVKSNGHEPRIEDAAA